MEIIANANAAGVGSNVLTPFQRVPQLGLPTVALIATKKSGSGNLDVTIQHSPNELDWFDWMTFTQLVDASGSEELVPTRSHFPFMRTKRTIGGNAVYDFIVYMDGIYGQRRA